MQSARSKNLSMTDFSDPMLDLFSPHFDMHRYTNCCLEQIAYCRSALCDYRLVISILSDQIDCSVRDGVRWQVTNAVAKWCVEHVVTLDADVDCQTISAELRVVEAGAIELNPLEMLLFQKDTENNIPSQLYTTFRLCW